MLKQYHTYIITRNWDCQLLPEMLDTSIFCYGKGKSGKTRNVGIPILENAITQGRSCILYADKPQDYLLCIDNARRNGYQILDLQVDQVSQDSLQKASQISSMLLEEQVLLIAYDRTFTQRTQTLLDDILLRLASDTADEPDLTVTIILDGLCGNMILKPAQFQKKALQYCVIMGSQIASFAWRRDIVSDLNLTVKDYYCPYDPANIADEEEIPNLVMQDFFTHIQTILCTGINGVKPQEHRRFAGRCFMDASTLRIGGKYVIEERPSPERSYMAQPLDKIQPVEIGDDIEQSEYSWIAQTCILPNMWIAEVNSQVCLCNMNTTLFPVVFPLREAGDEWLCDSCIDRYDLICSSKDCGPNISLYEASAPYLDSGAFSVTYTLTKVTAEDVDYYRIKYLLAVLRMSEIENLIASPDGKELLRNYQADNQFIEELTKVMMMYGAGDSFEIFLNKYMPQEEEAPSEEPQVPEPPEPEYKWDPDAWITTSAPMQEVPTPLPLPKDGVLFLGGHPNMTKKLKQIFPGWLFITDDYFKKWRSFNQHIIFYWTGHTSHKMMQFVNTRISEETTFLYVTATNIQLLIQQMEEQYNNYAASQLP